MMALLEGEASRHPLCVRRGEAYWRALLSREGTEVAVYEADGRVEGYVLYGQGEGRNAPRALAVSELVAAAPAAREALVSFMAAFDPTMFEVRYSTPRGEPLHPFLPSSYVEARVSPEFMLRLVNVEEALGLLQRGRRLRSYSKSRTTRCRRTRGFIPSGDPTATWSEAPRGRIG